MMKLKTVNWLPVAVLAAAVIVSATGIYLARQLADRPDEARVIELIEERLAQQSAATPAGSLDEARVSRLIDERMKTSKGGALSEKEFNERIERGILAFVDKQRQAEEQKPNQLAKNVPRPGKQDYFYGNPKAPITLIEYSDFECPFCKRFHPTAKQLIDESKGEVNWIYRHFPLDFHNPGAQKQAEAAECAGELGGNAAFWRYTDTVYERTRSNGKGFPIENLTPLAVEQGLDKEKFQQCLDSGRHARKVQQQLAEGQRAGVNGTPGNILYHNKTGNVVVVTGAQPIERLRKAVDTLKAR